MNDREEYRSSWTDFSIRYKKEWGLDRPGFQRQFTAQAEYQLAYRHFEEGGETDPQFVLPHDTLVHQIGLRLEYDTRARQSALPGQNGEQS